MSLYESHINILNMNSAYKIHLDQLKNEGIWAHWHENIEMLYFVSGSARVIMDDVTSFAHKGQVAVINSNTIHTIFSDDAAEYYCLIVDKTFLSLYGFSVEDISLQPVIDSPIITGHFDRILAEFSEESEHYSAQIKAEIICIMVELARSHKNVSDKIISDEENNKLLVTKSVLQFLQKNYKKNISLQDIADNVGFSKYYIAHLFKDIVGCSIVYYINNLRCQHAKTLLMEKKYSISEVAEKCGFENLSYFSKTYKKYMNVSPIDERK